MGLDLTHLQDVPLLMRRDEQRPLIPIALLPLDNVGAQVVAGGFDVFQQPIVMLAVLPRAACRSRNWPGGRSVGIATSGRVRSIPYQSTSSSFIALPPREGRASAA